MKKLPLIVWIIFIIVSCSRKEYRYSDSFEDTQEEQDSIDSILKLKHDSVAKIMVKPQCDTLVGNIALGQTENEYRKACEEFIDSFGGVIKVGELSLTIDKPKFFNGRLYSLEFQNSFLIQEKARGERFIFSCKRIRDDFYELLTSKYGLPDTDNISNRTIWDGLAEAESYHLGWYFPNKNILFDCKFNEETAELGGNNYDLSIKYLEANIQKEVQQIERKEDSLRNEEYKKEQELEKKQRTAAEQL